MTLISVESEQVQMERVFKDLQKERDAQVNVDVEQAAQIAGNCQIINRFFGDAEVCQLVARERRGRMSHGGRKGS